MPAVIVMPADAPRVKREGTLALGAEVVTYDRATESREKIAAHGATCWLVNTGWTGGAYGTGSRMPIKATRALLTAALEGSLAGVEYRKDPNFGFDVPVAVTGVADILLDPRRTWDNPESYDRQADKLVKMFAENFEQYLPYIDDDVKAAAIG